MAQQLAKVPIGDVRRSPAPDFGLLTTREREVLLLLAGGPSNRSLAQHLGVAERTVRAHLTSITRKLGVRSRLEAALLATVHHDALQPGAA
ncbi:helix-turn-helix transcriptional regulator [Streptomyces sp. NPDC059008]|uniref:helix-turn-helix domain-containing protein n=1 Tax=Streptomyces sp. NPDC059008 TaxID=3346693 RepID=UPI003685CFA3